MIVGVLLTEEPHGARSKFRRVAPVGLGLASKAVNDSPVSFVLIAMKDAVDLPFAYAHRLGRKSVGKFVLLDAGEYFEAISFFVAHCQNLSFWHLRGKSFLPVLVVGLPRCLKNLTFLMDAHHDISYVLLHVQFALCNSPLEMSGISVH